MPLYHPQNTLALLSLMGFDELQVRDDSYVSFRFAGEVYETARMEGCACIGIVREVYSDDEYFAVMETGDEMMGMNPHLQCLYSTTDCVRIRLWVPCADANAFESALLGGMDKMDLLKSDFESRVQHHLFRIAAPVFENILHKR